MMYFDKCFRYRCAERSLTVQWPRAPDTGSVLFIRRHLLLAAGWIVCPSRIDLNITVPHKEFRCLLIACVCFRFLYTFTATKVSQVTPGPSVATTIHYYLLIAVILFNYRIINCVHM